MVKKGEAKKHKLSKKHQFHNNGEFINFVEIRGIYKFYGNRGYVICIVGLVGWMPLSGTDTWKETGNYIIICANFRSSVIFTNDF